MSAKNIKTNTTYSFRTYAPGILGDYTDAFVVGIVGAVIASQFDDIASMHANVLGQLPNGIGADHSSLEYILIRTSAGKTAAIATVWIDMDSLQESEASSRLRVSIRGSGDDAIARLRHLLAGDGFDVEYIEKM